MKEEVKNMLFYIGDNRNEYAYELGTLSSKWNK